MFESILIVVSLASWIVNGIMHHNNFAQRAGSVLGSTVSKTFSPTPTSLLYIIITETPVPTSTPTPTTIPTATPIPTTKPIVLTPSQFDQLFSKYGQMYGVDTNLLRKIAGCESNFHTSSQWGDYAGLYQFSTSSWTVIRQSMHKDANLALRFNPEEAIKTAAYKIKMGGISSWPNCSK